MPSTQIGSGRLGLTTEWAIQKLEEHCPNFQKKLQNGLTVKELVTTQVSVEAGFMSYVYRVDVHFNGGTEDDRLSYCLKEPNSERMDKILGFDFFPMLQKLHQRECDFYTTFNNVEGLKVPKVIATKPVTEEDKNGYIFMEFSGQGQYRSIGQDRSLTLAQMLNVSEQIACLHAYALKNKTLWEGRFQGVNIVASTLEECEEVLTRIVGRLRTFCDEDLINRIDLLRDVLHNHTIYEHVVFKAHLEAGVPSIISHGDLWANNVLFKVNKQTGELADEVGGIVDWQATNAGNPAQDLVRIMLLNMDAEVRHASESKVFEHYYQKLNENLKKLGAEPAPFTLDQLTNAARPYFIYQLVLAMFIAAHHVFEGDNPEQIRAVFLERLREGLKDAQKNAHLWKK